MKFYSIKTSDGSTLFFPQDQDICIMTGVKMVDRHTGKVILDGKTYGAIIINGQHFIVSAELALLYLKLKAKSITDIK